VVYSEILGMANNMKEHRNLLFHTGVDAIL
jgi:hypothetical protein